MKKPTRTNKLTTNLLYVLDESGSMDFIKSSVISGFNEYIGGLRKGDFKVTLVKFDSNGIRTPYTRLPAKDVPKLNNDTYTPDATTPLYDAVVNSVENFAKEIPDGQPALVAIMTDGEENASREHTEKCLQELIGKLQARGNWTFVFMGANQDSWATATRWGIAKGNIANWQATSQGAKRIFASMAMGTASYSASLSKGESLSSSNFFDTKTGGNQS